MWFKIRLLIKKNVMPLAVLSAAAVLIYFIYVYQISEICTAIKKNIDCKSVEYSFSGSVNLSSVKIKSGDVNFKFKSVRLYFNPFYNFFKANNCLADVVIEEIMPVSIFSIDFNKNYVRAIIDGILKNTGVNNVKLRLSMKNGKMISDNFYNYALESAMLFTDAYYECESSSGGIKFLKACGVFLENKKSGEVELAKSNGASYQFNSRSLPLKKIKLNFKTRYFECSTGEVSLNFQALAADFSDSRNFFDVYGEADNFTVSYLPFNNNLKMGFRFKIEGDKILISARDNVNDSKDSKVTGFINYKSRSMSLEFLSSHLELSCFDEAFNINKSIVSNYSPSGEAKIFLKVEGAIDAPELYGEMSMLNAMLQGDAGFKNVNNISGNINFSKNKIKFNDLAGRLLNSKVEINGTIDISDAANVEYDMSVNFVDMAIADLRECMIFGEGESSRLLSFINDGKVTLNVKLPSSGRGSGFSGTGDFSRCKIGLPMRSDLVQFSEVGGKFAISNDHVKFADSYGFIGNVPFFFSGQIDRKALNKFNFNVKFNNLDFSEISFGEPFSGLFANISRIQVQNKSNVEFDIDSNGSGTISLLLNLNLDYPVISMFPLPFSISIEKVSGRIALDYTYGAEGGDKIEKPREGGNLKNDLLASSNMALKDLIFKMHGATKILLLSFLYQSFPVSISGYSEGEIGLTKKPEGDNYATGNIFLKNATVRYFDNKYVELFTKINDLNIVFSITGSMLNGVCKFGILDGLAKLDFKSCFLSANLYNALSFSLENAKLSYFYDENPNFTRYIDGTLNAHFKSAFSSIDKTANFVNGRAELKSGSISSLNRLEIVSKKDEIPDTIYDFSKFSFDFSLGKGRFKILNPSYEGSQKNEFLSVISVFNESDGAAQ